MFDEVAISEDGEVVVNETLRDAGALANLYGTVTGMANYASEDYTLNSASGCSPS